MKHRRALLLFVANIVFWALLVTILVVHAARADFPPKPRPTPAPQPTPAPPQPTPTPTVTPSAPTPAPPPPAPTAAPSPAPTLAPPGSASASGAIFSITVKVPSLPAIGGSYWVRATVAAPNGKRREIVERFVDATPFETPVTLVAWPSGTTAKYELLRDGVVVQLIGSDVLP